MSGNVNIKLKQTLKGTKIGKGSSVRNGGKRKFKMSVPFTVNITMKQSNKNKNLALHQGGSIKIAYNDKPSKTTTVNISQSNGNKPTVKKV